MSSTCLFLPNNISINLLAASISSFTMRGVSLSWTIGCSTLRSVPWGLSKSNLLSPSGWLRSNSIFICSNNWFSNFLAWSPLRAVLTVQKMLQRNNFSMPLWFSFCYSCFYGHLASMLSKTATKDVRICSERWKRPLSLNFSIFSKLLMQRFFRAPKP